MDWGSVVFALTFGVALVTALGLVLYLHRRTLAAVGAAVGGVFVAWAVVNACPAVASDSTCAAVFYLAATWVAGWLTGLLLAGVILALDRVWRRLRSRPPASATTRP